MVTNNLKKLAFGIICNSSSVRSDDPKIDSNNPIFVDIDGNNVTISMNTGAFKCVINALNHYINDPYNTILTAQQAGIGFVFGSGTTTPTSEDYTIETELTSITHDSINIGSISGLKKTFTATISNNTSTSITINEVGLVLAIYPYNDSAKKILLERTVLSTPIVLGAGETTNITEAIGF